jgi:N-acetylneuraminic acid mutarotase
LEGEFEMKITIQKVRLPAIFVLNLLVALGLPAVKPVAQTSATAKQTDGSEKFSLTGSMNATRALHTGQVLVAGGIVDTTTGESLASAELFNPARGKWRVTGSMSVARVFATATLLPNGEVLVAGGAPALNGDCVASTELFNPATGSWQATGSLNFAREGQLSAPLQNGNVLVAGGRDFVNGTFTDLASAELFEPSQGKWIVTSSLSIPDGTPFWFAACQWRRAGRTNGVLRSCDRYLDQHRLFFPDGS